MEIIVFNDSEVWRFQGKTKNYWLWKWGLGTFCYNLRGKHASKLRQFRKIGSQISVLSCIKTAVNMERTRPRNDRRQMAYTLIPPKRRKKEDQELNGLRKSIMPWWRKDWLKYGGNGWRKVATGKRQKSLKLMNRLAG